MSEQVKNEGSQRNERNVCPNCGNYHDFMACSVPTYVGELRYRLSVIEKKLDALTTRTEK